MSAAPEPAALADDTAAPAGPEAPDRPEAPEVPDRPEVPGGYVDVGPPPVLPPPSWVAAVRGLEPTLPALYVDPAMADQIDGCWQLHPWQPCGDIAALLAWAGHLDGLVTVWRSRSSPAAISVHGMLWDYPTRLVGSSHLLDSAYSLHLDLEELGRIAAKETAALRVDDEQRPPADAPAGNVWAAATAVLAQETVAVGHG